ncbi:MAG: inorganic phosphate transporter [bacterium]
MGWLSGGIFLGWALGANDAANVFGTAVSTHVVSFRRAAAIICIFVILGAVIDGVPGMRTLGGLAEYNARTAFIASFSAGVTVTMMTIFRLPVSTSQAVVGAIIGIGMTSGQANFSGLNKIIVCWIGTPLGAMVAAIVIYMLLSVPYNRISHNIALESSVLYIGFLVSGAYGAYALGANNVANVVGVYVGSGLLNPFTAAVVGAVSICAGVITFSKQVMFTVGERLVPLEAFTALVAVLAQAVTVHFYAIVGVPVSTSQAMVGAVLGVGIIKGVRSINIRILLNIIFGWVLTPCVAGVIAFLLYLIFHF